MTIEEMMDFDEQELWSGGNSEITTFWESVFNPLLPFAAIWGIFDLSFIHGAGIGNLLFTGMFFFFLIHMMPVWMYIGGIVTARMRARNTRYAVTTRGVYIQTGGAGREETKFYAYGDLKAATTKQGRFDEKYHVGDVFCEYVTPIMVRSGKNRRTEYGVKLDNLADFREVSQIVNAQLAETKRRQDAAAMNAWQNPMLARNIPQTYSEQATPVRPAVAVPNPMPQPKLKPQEVIDPQTAFFGQEGQALLQNFSREDFFGPTAAEQTALLKNLPDESVSELQAELFGADAEEQGAFADPTVNPLPELPGSEPFAYRAPSASVFPDPFAEPFRQPSAPAFPDYHNSTSPYALPPEQPAVPQQPQPPEMESLFTDAPGDDSQNGQFMQQGF